MSESNPQNRRLGYAQVSTYGQTRRAEGSTLKELAKSYNVGRATISRLAE